ncbi:tetratricopeptide repeat protein [Sulfitobacter sp. F26169L]|uniref:tetratricopeptide repeat protein n=1 Tax=Sulfitobacter sp. F26169L TaxID=2996015 RepID=UPI00226087F9|nr:tetratricopeptide repeat protein [Sulfitobacter sp. F26169L]MCX7566559.1 tetratricopeptide repeat protein [Sulfitobacter sp. F26169L]
MAQDLYGLPVTCENPDTLSGLNDFIHGFLSYHPKAANIIAAADDDPDCALENAYAAMLWMFLESPDAPQKATPYLARAQAKRRDVTAREALTIDAVAAWVAGDVPQVLAICDRITTDHPRDMTILKLAQYHMFNLGNATGMLRMALKALPQAANIAYAHGMIAFGYELCHLLDRAESAARQAMALQHDEAWAHHALAHVMLTQGRIAEGAAFLESVADTWRDLNSFMHTHNWWHLALFYLSLGRHDDVRRAYDTHVWGLEKGYSQDQVGAVSLLARMEFAGVDVGDRWRDVADHIAARGADTVNPFLTLQYLYALTRTHRPEAAELMQAIRDRASDTSQHDHIAWRDVALPAATGIAAYADGVWDTAISQLARALPRMSECGGSHAQRDLFEQIHLDALVQDGRASAAQQVLEMRRTYDPVGVPLNLLLGKVYAKSGLPLLAQEARARAAQTLAANSSAAVAAPSTGG